MNISEIIEQLESCHYECEAGPLENNVAWGELINLIRAERRRMGVGMPAELKLHEFGSRVWSAFGAIPYHVGSSLSSKQWRDVDVRLILSDEKWSLYGFGDPDRVFSNERWVAFCLAFSALGKEMTGLPIDFQIQQESDANGKYKGDRSAIGRVPLRLVGTPERVENGSTLHIGHFEQDRDMVQIDEQGNVTLADDLTVDDFKFIIATMARLLRK